mmetsp:Transcript_3497/g.8328  ORF Transcript_3497/g.8328 Transcript_3497/m.8328 type:complete len:376 (-) Transcript_3497:81-1208(-)
MYQYQYWVCDHLSIGMIVSRHVTANQASNSNSFGEDRSNQGLFFVLVPFSKYGYFLKQGAKDKTGMLLANLRISLLVVHQRVASRCCTSERSKEVSVLGRVRSVDQQPSSEPEVGDEAREQQEPGDKSVISREEHEQAGVDNVTDSGNPHRDSKITREDSPHADASSEHEHVHASENLLKVESVLVDQQEQVGNLGSDRRHVVGVEVLLDDLVGRAADVQQESGTDQEDEVGGADGLLADLKGTDGDSSGGVDTGADHDETKGDTDDNIDDADNEFEEDTDLVDGHVLGDVVGGLLGLLPFNKNPSDGDGSVDGGKDGDHSKDTGGQGGTSKALSSGLELLALLFVDGFGVRHLDELIAGRHDVYFFCYLQTILC